MPVANENRNDPFVSSYDVIKFLEAPIKDIRGGDHAEVLRELQFLVKHADRRQNELTFAKCQFLATEICDYCADNPVKSKETLEFLQKFNMVDYSSPLHQVYQNTTKTII